MSILKIGTWNIKNSYFNINKNEIKAAAVVQLLNYNELDFLALQEVNSDLAAKIDEKLRKQGHEYRILTRYKNSKIKNLRVEYNMIVGKNYPHTINKPVELPSIPKGINFVKKLASIRQRNIDFQYILTPVDQPNILMGVTHLDHAVEELGERQMKQVIDITRSKMKIYDDASIILAGNLNKKPTEKNMIEFTKQLSELGLQVVDNPYKTYIGDQNNQPVDYIIIPNDWEIQSCETLENYDDISSHRPVIVETIDLKKLILRKEM